MYIRAESSLENKEWAGPFAGQSRRGRSRFPAGRGGVRPFDRRSQGRSMRPSISFQSIVRQSSNWLDFMFWDYFNLNKYISLELDLAT